MHFSISASSSLKLMKYLYKAHMKAWYVLKGASVDFLGTEPFPGNMLSELCPMTSSMNSWSRNTTWPYAAICSSTDCKQLYNRSKPQTYSSTPRGFQWVLPLPQGVPFWLPKTVCVSTDTVIQWISSYIFRGNSTGLNFIWYTTVAYTVSKHTNNGYTYYRQKIIADSFPNTKWQKTQN